MVYDFEKQLIDNIQVPVAVSFVGMCAECFKEGDYRLQPVENDGRACKCVEMQFLHNDGQRLDNQLSQILFRRADNFCLVAHNAAKFDAPILIDLLISDGWEVASKTRRGNRIPIATLRIQRRLGGEKKYTQISLQDSLMYLMGSVRELCVRFKYQNNTRKEHFHLNF